MKSTLFICLTVTIFVMLILLYSTIESRIEPFTTIEPFTPGLKKMYQPYMRKSRVYLTNAYDNLIKKSRVAFKKIGVI
jgi:hypothetical protein